MGPEYGESARTPELLAEAGIRYVCDWVNDEQPYRMKTSCGELVSLPVMLELDDVHALWERRVQVDRYERLLVESFDVLHRDGARNGRLLVLHLHPWLIGQPFRIRFLDAALGEITGARGGVGGPWKHDCRLVPAPGRGARIVVGGGNGARRGGGAHDQSGTKSACRRRRSVRR